LERYNSVLAVDGMLFFSSFCGIGSNDLVRLFIKRSTGDDENPWLWVLRHCRRAR